MKIGPVFALYIMLVGFTHQVLFGGLSFLFIDLPRWSYEISFFIIAGIYTCILIKYPVRIDIVFNNKQILHFNNRRNH